MLKVGTIGVVGVLLAVFFQRDKKEYGIYMGVAVSLLIFSQIIGKLEQLIRAVSEIFAYIHMRESYLGSLIKILGVTYLAEFSADICKDSGYGAVASQIELFGKITILVLSLPILNALLQTIAEFLT